MNESGVSNTAVAGLGFALFGIILVFSLIAYLFFCFCGKRICEKCGVQPGILIWIPIVQVIPLLQAAKLPVWVIVLFLIPIVGFITGIYLWIKLCTARGKSPLLIIGIVLLPIIFIPYLAFSE